MIDQLSLTPALINALGWALVHALWQGAVIAALLAAARRLTPSSPGLRYVLACTALAGMLAAPAATFVALATTPAAVERAGLSDAKTLTTTVAAAPTSPSAPVAVAPRAIAGDVSPVRVTPRETTAPAAVNALDRLREALAPALPTLVWLWMAGLMIGVLRVGGGLVFAGRLRSAGAHPLPIEWTRTVERLARRFGLSRPIAARSSTRVGSPSVIGWLRPVLLVPAAALGGLSPQQLEAVLAHELAHIRRHDYLVNLLQMVAETVLFYHPAVWYVSRCVRMEREHCCDDLAVAACGDPVVYASALAELERLRLVCAPALALTATRGPLLRRIERLLDAPSRHSAPASGVLAIAATAILAAGASLFAWNPTTRNNDRDQDPRPVAAPPAATTPGTPAPATPTPTPGPTSTSRPAARAPVAVDGKTPAPAAGTPVAASTPAARRPVAVVGGATTPVAAAADRDDWDWPPAPPAPPALAAPAAPPAPPAPAAVPVPVAPPAAGVPAAPPRWSTQPPPPAAPAPPAPPAPAPAGAPAAPSAPPAPAAPPAPPSQDGFSSDSRHGDVDFNWSNNGDRLRIRANGDVVFNDEDTDIVRIDDGDRFEIEEKRGGVSTRIEIRKGADGRLERRWWKDGREASYEPEGRAWLAKRLPDIVRRTGLGADARIARILAKSGPSGVLDEVSLIPGDFVKGRYLTKLLASTALDAANLERLITQAGRELKSDFELGRVLTTTAKKGLPGDRLRLTYVDASRSLNSAFESGRVLIALVNAGPNSGTVASAIVKRAATITSDFELSRVLVAVLEAPGGRETLSGPFFETLLSLNSDFERGRVLNTAARLPDLSEREQIAILDATQKTKSSFEASRILTTLLGQQRLTEASRARFVEVAQSLGSSFERDRVLARLAVAAR